MTFRGCFSYFLKWGKLSQVRNFWWVKPILMKLIYLKSVLKCDSFDVTIGIKILFFRVSVTIEPGRFLLQFVTTNCLIMDYYLSKYIHNTFTLFLFALKVGNKLLSYLWRICNILILLHLATHYILAPN